MPDKKRIIEFYDDTNDYEYYTDTDILLDPDHTVDDVYREILQISLQESHEKTTKKMHDNKLHKLEQELERIDKETTELLDEYERIEYSDNVDEARLEELNFILIKNLKKLMDLDEYLLKASDMKIVHKSKSIQRVKKQNIRRNRSFVMSRKK